MHHKGGRSLADSLKQQIISRLLRARVTSPELRVLSCCALHYKNNQLACQWRLVAGRFLGVAGRIREGLMAGNGVGQ